jgi:endonuclease III
MEAVAALTRFYGRLPEVEPKDPFEIIVWENVAYLVDDGRRRAAFDALRRDVGIAPQELLRAGPRTIERSIESGGMQPNRRAEKLMRCAQIAIDDAGGDLLAALRELEPKGQRRLLKRFPGIGDPGADKVLLLCGLSNRPALDSNGVRVLERLGVISSAAAYARSYRNATDYLWEQGVRTTRSARAAFKRLRQHGRTLCKRAQPQCPECPLLRSCAFGQKRRLLPAGASWGRRL